PRRLPAPRFAEPGASRAPAPGAETMLAGLFAELLGRGEVGVDDSFFALGGDSILSIQLVARARAEGLSLTPRDVFAARTVRALAALVGDGAAPAPATAEDPDEGPVAFTPLMRAFLDRGGPLNGHHMAAVVGLPRDVGVPELERILAALIERHAMLEPRLLGERGDMRFDVAGSVDTTGVVGETEIDLDGPGAEAAFDRARREAIARLDPYAGRMVTAVRVANPGGNPALILVVHHFVVDGVSLRVLLDDLATAGAAVAQGGEIALAPAGTSMRRWTAALAREAVSARRAAELDTWRTVLDGPDPLVAVRRVDPVRDLWSDTRTHVVTLDPVTTAAVLTDVPEVFYAGPDDVLLTGLGLAVAAWRRSRGVDEASALVTVESHGRIGEAVPDSADLSRTVGWFTSQYPVRLDASGVDLAEAVDGGPGAGVVLKRVKEHLRSLPDRGLGYGLLRWLNPDTAGELAAFGEPQIAFNFLGRVDTTGSGPARPWTLRPGGISAGSDPGMPVAVTLVLNAVAEDGPDGPRLVGHWSYPAGLLDPDAVAALAEAWIRALRGLARHGTSGGAGGHTPSDMPLVSLDQGDLDALEGRWGSV
ncbi:condensation domain-containing protein, partial [Actinoallomurus acaciae]